MNFISKESIINFLQIGTNFTAVEYLFLGFVLIVFAFGFIRWFTSVNINPLAFFTCVSVSFSWYILPNWVAVVITIFEVVILSRIVYLERKNKKFETDEKLDNMNLGRVRKNKLHFRGETWLLKNIHKLDATKYEENMIVHVKKLQGKYAKIKYMNKKKLIKHKRLILASENI